MGERSSGGHVVEIAIFRVKPGVTREALLGTVDGVSAWAERQPGFLSRDLTYSAEDDSWIDVIWWEDLASAKTAAEAALTSESCVPMFELIDLDEVRMLHGERVASIAARQADVA